MDETSQKIIDATMSLVRNKGYAATTTKDIAYAAGVNECILFRKFKNKKDIVLNGVAQEKWRAHVSTLLVTGIATANFDSVPLVCFTGQVPTGLLGNAAFQEVDIAGITRSICKYAVTVRRREDPALIIKKTFTIARTGKADVVVVNLPKDIRQQYGSSEYPERIAIRAYKPNQSVHAGQLKKALEALNQAQKAVVSF